MPSATTSDYLHDLQMNYLLKNTDWTPPASLWVALFITKPGLDGTGGTEVSTSGTGYARVEIEAADGWQGPSGNTREFSNIANVVFGTPTANWGTITGAGLYDHETNSTHLFYVANLTTSKTVNLGDGAPQILAGQLRISRAVC